MFARPRILEFLRHVDEPAADQALGAAIPHVDPYLQIELVDMLLRRNRREGLFLLPELFDQVNETAQARIIAGSSKLFSALRTTIRSPNTQTRHNSLHIIRRGSNPRLAYLAAVAIRDGAARIRADAALTLRDMAEQHLSSHAQTTAILLGEEEPDGRLAATIVATVQMLNEERRYLLSALREALCSFESHHRPEVVEAAILFADELEDVLFPSGALARGKLTHSMVESIGDHLLPHHAPYVYISLGYPEFRRRIVSLLASCRDIEFFIEFIRCHWLMRDPKIRKHLGAIRTIEWLGDGFEPAFTLPPEIAAMTPSWLVSLGVSVDQKVAVLSNFLMIDAPDANRAAVWALTQIDTPSSTLALQSALEHEVASVREIAEREIQFRSLGTTRSTQRPRSDRPTEWSRLLESAGITEDFEDLWQNFERIASDQTRTAGQLAEQYIPGFSIRVRTRLVDPNAVERVRAVRLVVSLQLSSRFSREIYNLCNDSVIEVRAAAIRALGQIGDLTSRRILERAVVQEAPAVQARAVEALGQLGNLGNTAPLMPLLDSEDATVRAATVRLLLRKQIPRAASALVAMLQDGRIGHRCNALWIVDQLRLTTMAARVQDLAISDPEPRIARTAQQVLRRLHKFKSAAEKSKLAPTASEVAS